MQDDYNFNPSPVEGPSKSEGSNLPVKAFPTSKGELLANRLNQKTSNLHAVVEEILLNNMDDPELKEYLEAWDDDMSVTGKCQFDDFKAAERLQELSNLKMIEDAKTTVIMKSMIVVLRRFGQTRKQRIATAQSDADKAARAAGLAGE